MSAVKEKKKRKLTMPDTLIIVAAIVMLAAIMSWVVPSGTYEYQQMDVNGTMRDVVINGTYHEVPKSEVVPTGFLGLFGSFYRGCVSAADIIFVILFCCGTFGVLVKTGAFHSSIGTLLRKLGNKGLLIIPIFMILFGLGGSVFGMLSEFYGFYPLLIGLTVAMGYDAMLGFAVVALGEFVGFMGATLNPYSVAVAQAVSGVELYSGLGFRAICFLVFQSISIAYVIRYAKKIKKNPLQSLVYGDESVSAFSAEELESYEFSKSDGLVLLDVLVTMVILMFGLMKWGWGYAELCGLFLIMSIVAATIKRWSPNKWCAEFIDSAKVALWGAILTGVAKGIVVVMQDAMIMDTFIYYLSNLLENAPRAISAQLMLVVQTLFNFIIPSGSGQAVATMPIMAPLSDLIGVTRQTACLAFQFGDGLSNLLWPTCGIVIVCGIGGIKLEKWYKFFLPLFGILFATQVVLLSIAVMIGF